MACCPLPIPTTLFLSYSSFPTACSFGLPASIPLFWNGAGGWTSACYYDSVHNCSILFGMLCIGTAWFMQSNGSSGAQALPGGTCSPVHQSFGNLTMQGRTGPNCPMSVAAVCCGALMSNIIVTE